MNRRSELLKILNFDSNFFTQDALRWHWEVLLTNLNDNSFNETGKISASILVGLQSSVRHFLE